MLQFFPWPLSWISVNILIQIQIYHSPVHNPPISFKRLRIKAKILTMFHVWLYLYFVILPLSLRGSMELDHVALLMVTGLTKHEPQDLCIYCPSALFPQVFMQASPSFISLLNVFKSTETFPDQSFISCYLLVFLYSMYH